MSAEASRIPSRSAANELSAVDRMLKAKRIVVVGISEDSSRPSHGIAGYLISHGYDVVGVNPNSRQVQDWPCYASLAAVAGPIGVVNVFRRSEFCEEVTREAIAAGAKGVWLQAGIRNDAARELAENAGIDFVQDRCIMVEHMHRRR